MEEETITSILKVLFMILFFGIVCFVGTLPLRSKAFKSNPKLRIFGSTFAGALFINVAILHILPESADTLENYLRDGQKTEDGDDIEVFPLANLLLMVGFLITIFFTKILTKH
jgi:zinc transporter 1/2/3